MNKFNWKNYKGGPVMQRIFAMLAMFLMIVVIPVYAMKVNSDTLNAQDEYVSVPVENCNAASLQIGTSSGWTGTFTIEGTVDNSEWVTIPYVVPTTGATSTTLTMAGLYNIPTASYTQVRARLSTFTPLSSSSSGGSNPIKATLRCASGNQIGVVPSTASLSATSLGTFPFQPASYGHIRKAVTTAGTSVLLSSDQVAGEYFIKALPTNMGYIYIQVGGTTGMDYSGTGTPLAAGEPFVGQPIANLNEIAIDASVSGEGVSVYFQNY